MSYEREFIKDAVNAWNHVWELYNMGKLFISSGKYQDYATNITKQLKEASKLQKKLYSQIKKNKGKYNETESSQT